MRHVPSSCVEGEVKQSQSQGVLPAEGATFFEVRCGNRQGLLLSPLQLSTCEREPGGVWSQHWLNLGGFKNTKFFTDNWE